MSGMIAVREYTSAADMIAEGNARRKRLMGKPPIHRKQAARVAEIFRIVRVREYVQNDAHVYARYKHMAENPSYLRKAIDTAVEAAIARAKAEAEKEETSGIERVLAVPIIKEMCRFYGLTHLEVQSSRRTRTITFPRQKMMWVLKNNTSFSYPEIGQKFGGRDHTTVLHAVRKIDKLVAAGDPSVAELGRWLS